MHKKTNQVIDLIEAPVDEAADAVIGAFKASQQAASPQLPLDLEIEVQKDIDGVEMGILKNGIPYLNQRGLSEATGVVCSLIQTVTKEWEDHSDDRVIGKVRISNFKQYLFANGYYERTLHMQTV